MLGVQGLELPLSPGWSWAMLAVMSRRLPGPVTGWRGRGWDFKTRIFSVRRERHGRLLTAPRRSIVEEIELREAGPEDITAVTDCVCRAYLDWIEVIGRQPGPMLDDYQAVIQQHTVYMALKERRVVGVLVLKTGREGYLLDNVAVHPEYQGQGIARHLMAKAEQCALESGYTSIHLYTHERMTSNHKRYRAMGYEEYDRRTEGALARIYFRKSLY